MIQSIFFETISFWTLLILLIFWKLRCFILLGWETSKITWFFFFFFYKAVFNNVHSLSCIFLSCYPLRSTIQYLLLFIISLLCYRWYLRDEKWEKKCYENYLFQFYSPQYIFQFYCSAVSVPEGGHFKAGQVHLPSAIVPSQLFPA